MMTIYNELIVELKHIVDTQYTKYDYRDPSIYGKYIYKCEKNYIFCKKLDDWINNNLNVNTRSNTEKLYILINYTNELYKCKMCGHKTYFINSTRGYRIYCSKNCENMDISYLLKKRKLTNLKKYNTEHPMMCSTCKEKQKTTNNIRYGYDYYFQTNSFKNKSLETCLRKYGTKYGSQTEKFKNDYKITCLQNYNVTNPSKNFDICEKQVDTKRVNFVKSLLNSDRLSNIIMPLFDINEYKDVTYIYNWKCKICNTEFIDNIICGKIPRCPTCYPIQKSRPQLDIEKFIKISNIISNDRKVLYGKELDIYIPSHNLAIEFNGIYWHSEGNGKSRNYHLTKTNECLNKNIQLLHIFENEWLNPIKREIWKSIINNKLGICDTKIFARKCTINKVDNKTAKQFLLNNHLQGHTPSSVNIGLYYENELVSLMTFGKSRYNKNYQYELIRFCNKINTLVTGGASKIFSHFNKTYNPESIISYADLRYSNGALYEKLGFNKLKNSTPNYFYFHKSDTSKLTNRVQFQKHKLKNKLDIYNSELTEYQNMLNNGYDRIWDCGNGVYEYINS